MSQHRKIFESKEAENFSKAVCDMENKLAQYAGNDTPYETTEIILINLANNPSANDLFDGSRVLALAFPESAEYANHYIGLLKQDDFANSTASKGYRAISEAYAYGLRQTFMSGKESPLHQVTKNKITDLLETESLQPDNAKKLLGHIAFASKKHNSDLDTKRKDIFGTIRKAEYPNQYPVSPFVNDMAKFTEITDIITQKHENDQTYFWYVMDRFSETWDSIGQRARKVLHLQPKAKNDNIIN